MNSINIENIEIYDVLYNDIYFFGKFGIFVLFMSIIYNVICIGIGISLIFIIYIDEKYTCFITIPLYTSLTCNIALICFGIKTLCIRTINIRKILLPIIIMSVSIILNYSVYLINLINLIIHTCTDETDRIYIFTVFYAVSFAIWLLCLIFWNVAVLCDCLSWEKIFPKQ
jgi:hypothetical protein